jgi:hypothetical protein
MELSDFDLFATMDFVHEFALYFFLVCCFFLRSKRREITGG